VRPLDGITVIALEQAIAVPFCTRQLADLGARVIKVERPVEGDFARAYDHRTRGLSSHFVWCNRSKESLSLNLKHPEAQRIFHALLPKTDVLIQNLSPGVTTRFGLNYDALKDRYPRLIVCDLSGYGDGGPYSDRKAYDLLIQSESGFLSITGTPEQPSKAGCSIADISAGMYSYTNILAALLTREKTGKGSRIDITLLESMVEWMGHPMYYAIDGAAPPQRHGAAHSTIYPYGPFQTADDVTIMIAIQNDREWKMFCETVLQRPELGTDARFIPNAKRVAARGELGDLIARTFAQLPATEVFARLEDARIANSKINEMADVWAHPQLRARGRWTEVGTAAGTIPALIPPGLAPSDARMDPVPAIGEHTDAILAECGYSAEDIARLRRESAI
jgi:itaconate CoA-transferase